MQEDVQCPYCGKWNEVRHDDGFGCEEDVLHQMECWHCENMFVFFTEISFHYESKKADCLNTSEHEWRRSLTYPKEWSHMQCKHCGTMRDMTNEERTRFGIDMARPRPRIK